MSTTASTAADERLRFVIYEDNGGRFHWRLVGGDGAPVAFSAVTFDSLADAQGAATDFHRDAGAGAAP